MSVANAPVNIVRGTHAQLILFLVLNMWTSHFGLPVILGIVLLSKRVQRHPTFVNLLLAFIIVGISSSLLVYAGKTTGPEPSSILCLLQASLLYGVPALTSTAALILVFRMFITIRATFYGADDYDRDHVIRLWAMLIAPYVAFFISVLATAIIGAANPGRISRSRRFFYCSVESDSLTNTLTIFSAITLFSTLVLIVWTVVLLFRRWQLSKRGSYLKWTVDLSLPLRIIAFGIYIIAAMSLSLLSIKSPSNPAPDLVIASASTAVVLVFGTQTDILGVLCFWRRPRDKVSETFHVDLNQAFDQLEESRPWASKPLPPKPRPF
ncbi:hypothetical protein M413DRAFT_298403 [Hebeloma cylindrosporum]|uniref:G-protein coupled receptors family 1 profile domain-containing protein n=1 Tax=Hebeloma cylindrosporum TaxID=76867 RepID=A0A0C2YY83_HEBCY|nr:hypothetical protein M413DRAFT_298403 [Hebeloma cylindrosporum h7]